MTGLQLAPPNLRFEALGPAKLDEIAHRYPLRPDLVETVRLYSQVIPFRVNDYVLSELIDWSAVPDDPIFQLVFPVEGMLPAAAVRELAAAVESGDRARRAAVVARIQAGMNPHPSAQRELNVPTLAGNPIEGMQHKYTRTVLYFPQHGQLCHSYCTYCFRWAQFIGDRDLRFAASGPEELISYLRAHPEVTDVLVTGGDPMMMSAARLRQHLEPLLAIESVRTIRIGTKSVAYWPNRFVADADSDEVLGFFEQIVATGRNLALMAHYSHERELSTPVSREAVRRVLDTGALMYCQAPLIAHVNDDAAGLARLWTTELALGAVPYYLFVARDTGPHEYFKVPLARAQELFASAYRDLPGLARTLRGPVMSATPGKVVIDGPATIGNDPALALRFLQARDSALVGRPFFARFDPAAAWLDELELLPGTPPDIAAAVNSSAHQAGEYP
ncbi:MAG: lysine 2,3-aminomutase [Actinomycetota bacterium]|nr:lysine 2,3-aminomutase [Actinomycetota bacterium]MDQ2956665.1 lysine 2,3-aminomutase [Actinomycetota bacterium]